METHFEYWEGKDGQWYFHLVNKNKELQFVSEAYTSEDHVKRGIEDAVDAVMETVDHTIGAEKVHAVSH